MKDDRSKSGSKRGDGDVLDVKLRSQKARSHRWRGMGRAMVVLLATGSLLFAFWHAGNWAVSELVYGNEVFRLESIEVVTDGMLAERHLRRWAGVNEGSNLLGADLRRARRDLELMPWVKHVVMKRRLPDTLRIEVTERAPVAQVYAVRRASTGSGYDGLVLYLDAEGYVFPPRDRWMKPDVDPTPRRPYPSLKGFDLRELRQGRRVESEQVRAAMQLLARFNRSPMAERAAIRSVSVEPVHVIEVETFSGGRILFDRADIERQLYRWYAVHVAGRQLNREIAFLDLSVSNNVPARWKTNAIPETRLEGASNQERDNV